MNNGAPHPTLIKHVRIEYTAPVIYCSDLRSETHCLKKVLSFKSLDSTHLKELGSCVIPSYSSQTALPLVDLTGIRDTNDQRKGHSFQIGGNDRNDLRWFSAGVKIGWQVRKPKKKKKKPSLTAIAVSLLLTQCWHSNSKQDAVDRTGFVAVECHGGIV